MDTEKSQTEEAPLRLRAIFLGIGFYSILVLIAELILVQLVLGPKAAAFSDKEIMQKLNDSDWTTIYEWAFRPLLTVISGYMCGLYAQKRMTQHGFFMGLIITFSCFTMFVMEPQFGSHATDLAGFLMIIPMATLGGWLASISRPKTAL